MYSVDIDTFVLSFATKEDGLIDILQHNKDDVEFSEVYKSQEVYNSINEKVLDEMENETSPVLVINIITVLRSNSHCFSYNSNV